MARQERTVVEDGEVVWPLILSGPSAFPPLPPPQLSAWGGEVHASLLAEETPCRNPEDAGVGASSRFCMSVFLSFLSLPSQPGNPRQEPWVGSRRS